jgi:hypothetical protein
LKLVPRPLAKLAQQLVPPSVLPVPLLAPLVLQPVPLVPPLALLVLQQVLLARQVPQLLAPASSPPPLSLAYRSAPWPRLAQLSRRLPSLQATATAPRRTTDRVCVALRRRMLPQKQERPGHPGLLFILLSRPTIRCHEFAFFKESEIAVEGKRTQRDYTLAWAPSKKAI